MVRTLRAHPTTTRNSFGFAGFVLGPSLAGKLPQVLPSLAGKLLQVLPLLAGRLPQVLPLLAGKLLKVLFDFVGASLLAMGGGSTATCLSRRSNGTGLPYLPLRTRPAPA